MLKGICRKYKDDWTFKAILWSFFSTILITIVGCIVGYTGENLYIHILFILLHFWAKNGFQLAFGYTGLCLIVPTISFSDNKVGKYYIRENVRSISLFSTFLLLVSLIAALMEGDLSTLENSVIECEYGFVRGILYAFCLLLVTLTLMYVPVFISALRDMFSHKDIEQYCDEILAKLGQPSLEEFMATIEKKRAERNTQ